MTCRAVTPEDLRRVVLDVRGVKNAWIEKMDAPAPPLRYDPEARTLSSDTGATPQPNTESVALSGLWLVLVADAGLRDVDATTLRRVEARRLHANRPLCGDFEDL